MSAPGFTAERSLEPARSVYRGRQAYQTGDIGEIAPQWGILIDFGGPIPPPASWPVPWGVDAQGNIIWKLWQFFPGAAGAEAGAGWTLGLGGMVLVAIGAIAAGTLIGAGLGLGLEELITPDSPPAGAPSSTCTVVGPNTQHLITKSYWGCDRSYSLTLRDADNDCKARTGRCAGSCPNGLPCTPFSVVSSVAQKLGFFSCDTSVYYTCQCGC